MDVILVHRALTIKTGLVLTQYRFQTNFEGLEHIILQKVSGMYFFCQKLASLIDLTVYFYSLPSLTSDPNLRRINPSVPNEPGIHVRPTTKSIKELHAILI